MKDKIRLMMRLEDKVKKKWKKTRKKIARVNKYEFSTVTYKEFQKGLDQLMGCLLETVHEETAKLQREDHKENIRKEED